MGKCKWKDGKFEPCDRFNRSSSINRVDNLAFIEEMVIKCCPFCGADIRKSEAEQATHEEIRQYHIKVVQESMEFPEFEYRDTIKHAVTFLLQPAELPEE